MTDAMTPNQATLVTTLAATDHLLATDANGNLKRITRANVVSQGTKTTFIPVSSFSSGWVRVASLVLEGFGLLSVNLTWSIATTQALLLSVAAHINGFRSANSVKNAFPSNRKDLTKARIVRKAGSNQMYLDLYLSNKPGSMYITLLSAVNMSLIAASTDPAVDASDVVEEFSVMLSGGGGKALFHNVLERRCAA